MGLVELCEVELAYGTLESLDYDAGGQLYGPWRARSRGNGSAGRWG